MPTSLAWRQPGRGLDWLPTASWKGRKRPRAMGGNNETRLYPADDDLQPQSGRGTERSAHVGPGPPAVRARQEIHPRNRRPDVGRIRKARREEDRSLEFYARTTRLPAEGQGQGQGRRPLEL